MSGKPHKTSFPEKTFTLWTVKNLNSETRGP
ncbi:hypothetical protein Y027_2939 [Burkholderia pseudomallei TSV5]|nr:hypothetical protein DO70_3517 [Burkholderia pseudomallei]KGX59133.1 hypothetical protein Y027_2939 [Burkholderia pseudomallei TSV5]